MMRKFFALYLHQENDVLLCDNANEMLLAARKVIGGHSFYKVISYENGCSGAQELRYHPGRSLESTQNMLMIENCSAVQAVILLNSVTGMHEVASDIAMEVSSI